MKSNIGRTILKITTTTTVLFMFSMSGCGRPVSSGVSIDLLAASVRTPNAKVNWAKPEFLYTDALDSPIEFPIDLDGTLVPSLTRYRINDMPVVPAQFETYINALTVSPDYHSVYLHDSSTDPINSLGCYRVGRQGWLEIKQAFTTGDKTDSPKSMAFVGRKQFLYVMCDQYRADIHLPNRYVLLAYRFGIGGRVERVPGKPVVAASYTIAAFVANPGIVPAYAISSPSVLFLYVVRPEDHYLDVYRIKLEGVLSSSPIASIPLGYRPGKSVFLPGGRILYVADADHECLVGYQIGLNGTPVPLPKTVPGIDPVLNPQGHFLYATPRWGRRIFCYTVLRDGTLRLQGTTPTRAICTAPCVDATGRFVYALGQDPVRLDEHVISQFRITSNGTLLPLQPEQVPAVGSTVLVTAQ